MKEPTPDIYKIIYKLSRWKTKSERYFTVFSAQEAIDDFYYIFQTGHVNSNCVTVYDVVKYDRFADRWYTMLDTIETVPENVTRDKKLRLVFKR